jgi:hypothetical protein
MQRYWRARARAAWEGRAMRRWAYWCVLLPGLASAQPFERTEQREPCRNFVPTRQPLFGELHLHTQYSADAATLDTRNTPRDAYRFAKGDLVGLPPFVDTRTNLTPDPTLDQPWVVSPHPYCLPPARCEHTATRTVQLPPGRALDFAAITDHAETIGEDNICFFEGNLACDEDDDCPEGQTCILSGRCVPRGYLSPVCILVRQEPTTLFSELGTVLFSNYVTAETPQRFPFCSVPGGGGDGTCIFQAKNVWEQIIADAEEAYDRSEACRFTSFVAYEYTAMPAMGRCAVDHEPCFADADCRPGVRCETDIGGGNNLHRNIIFRNANVPDLPVSYMEEPTGCGDGLMCRLAGQGGALASPAALLRTLARQCNASNGCDFLSIPHNSNMSGGAMFLTPANEAEATIRAEREPLVELFQIKGSSECRFDARRPGAWGTFDELCAFEAVSFNKLGGPFLPDPGPRDILPGSFVRNALKLGLQYEQSHGINPYRLGFVGGLDNHNGTPGASEASMYAKAAAHGNESFVVSGQALNETYFLGYETNGGGLTGVWAEENSRDSIFAALQRRETWATSGTRPVVRFFGGFDLPENICRGDFVRKGYRRGVPMGGTIEGPGDGSPPTFAVAATMDPGWPGHPGTKLQLLQIVKGWVDEAGETHEQVFTIDGDPSVGNDVDLRTCRTSRRGMASACAVFTDPDFDPDQHAFYYARVVENPSCRWNQYYCASRGIDCSRPSRASEELVAYTEFEYMQCCGDAVPKTVQQRAWTSPIFYEPGE